MMILAFCRIGLGNSDGAGVTQDAHLSKRGLFPNVYHPEIGERHLLGWPWKLSEESAIRLRHAPLLGEHNDYVFGELLGLSSNEIKRLEESEVIW